jgi:hypothetical protein
LQAKPGERHALPHRSLMSGRGTPLIPWVDSRVSSIPTTCLVKRAHPANEGRPKRRTGGNYRVFSRGLEAKPDAWTALFRGGVLRWDRCLGYWSSSEKLERTTRRFQPFLFGSPATTGISTGKLPQGGNVTGAAPDCFGAATEFLAGPEEQIEIERPNAA